MIGSPSRFARAVDEVGAPPGPAHFKPLAGEGRRQPVGISARALLERRGNLGKLEAGSLAFPG